MNKGFDTKKNSQKPPFGVFLSATVILFVLTLSVADSIGLVPDYIDGTGPTVAQSDQSTDQTSNQDVAVSDLPQLGDSPASKPQTTPAATPAANTAKPVRILIPSIDMDLAVQNPSTRDLDTLDTLLQKGPARYEDSALLGEKGNVIIFAHSSHLPVVHNLMYKAFNRVPELSQGDSITLIGDDGQKYLYSVTDVHKADASDATIDINPAHGTRLTLVTCDTLTGKSARFILDADFVGIVSI